MAIIRGQELPTDADAASVAAAQNRQAARTAAQANTGAGFKGGVMAAQTVAGTVPSTITYLSKDTTAGALTDTLPFAREYPTMIFYASRSAGANAYKIAAATGDTIDGGADITVTVLRMIARTGATSWTSHVIG